MAETRMPNPIDTLQSPATRAWFAATHRSPTPIQEIAWPAVAGGHHALLIAPTGTGKTLAAALPILDRWFLETRSHHHRAGLRCVYVSPMRSLCADVARNLNAVISAINGLADQSAASPIIAVRTGDTPSAQRRSQRARPPAMLVTTPESLALMLSQPSWLDVFKTVEHILIDEIHELIPSKRGADLSLSLERLSIAAQNDPQRVGLSATCRPAAVAAHFLGGTRRDVQICESQFDAGKGLELRVDMLIGPGEAPYRPLVHGRIARRVHQALDQHRTTIVFANTRALTEKVTHDLLELDAKRGADADRRAAAHHSALDAQRRRDVEHRLKAGNLAAVVTSTSLELGVDLESVEMAMMLGPPPSIARCLQRVGRSGHRARQTRRGQILAASAAELIAAAAIIEAANAGEIEHVKTQQAPLDVLCQQLIGMACAGEQDLEHAYELVRRATPFARLSRPDFESCVAFLAGQDRGQRSRPGRIALKKGRFSIHGHRVMRWLWSNIGTITSEENVPVMCGGVRLGTLEAAYAESLQIGDRFVLDGRALRVLRQDPEALTVETAPGPPALPRWTNERLGFSTLVAQRAGDLRAWAAQLFVAEGALELQTELKKRCGLPDRAAAAIVEAMEAQARISEFPPRDGLLIEHHPTSDGYAYVFHASLGRAACEALARAVSVRMGVATERNLALAVADLGWSITLPDPITLDQTAVAMLLDSHSFESDVLRGLEHGALLGREFRRVATTALMVLRNPGHNRTRVGGSNWVGERLYKLLRDADPDHPLIREAQRSVLNSALDTPTALKFLESKPVVQIRALPCASPFALEWIDPAHSDELAFETPAAALERLQQRLWKARRDAV